MATMELAAAQLEQILDAVQRVKDRKVKSPSDRLDQLAGGGAGTGDGSGAGPVGRSTKTRRSLLDLNMSTR